ncbi:MAG: hypothetical protein KDN05_10490, partial [Verrucomicrobiae bacterium]|nr:hypothetical protein [Verrucomicrobiae bacterium]
ELAAIAGEVAGEVGPFVEVVAFLGAVVGARLGNPRQQGGGGAECDKGMRGRVERVGAGGGFVFVGDAVAIGIDPGGEGKIADPEEFPCVGEAVEIGIATRKDGL